MSTLELLTAQEHQRCVFAEALQAWRNTPAEEAARCLNRWTALAFADFSSPDPAERDRFLQLITDGLAGILSCYEVPVREADRRRLCLQHLIDVCGAVCGLDVWHPSIRLKSLDDVNLGILVLARLIEALTDPALWPEADPLTLAKELTDYAPDSRAGWIYLGELSLRVGALERALECSRQALALRSTCPTAELLMRRVYQEKVRREPGTVVQEVALSDLSDRFCPYPFEYLALEPDGALHICSACYLPYSVGNLNRGQTAEELWNSPAAVEVRRSILDGDFSYCLRTQCDKIIGNRLPRKQDVTDPLMRQYIDNHQTVLSQGPRAFTLDTDRSCNLACPSCRTDIIMADPEQQERYARMSDLLLPLLKKTDGILAITNAGDPFASKHFLSILARLTPEQYPTLRLQLNTNGLLFTPELWERLPGIHTMVEQMAVSIDAARLDTYEDVRRPGRWSVLLDRLDFISRLRREGKIRYFRINFVVQEKNFREMRAFVKFGRYYGCDIIFFQKLRSDFLSYDAEEFQENDVCSPAHPDHAALLEILADPTFQQPDVDLRALRALRALQPCSPGAEVSRPAKESSSARILPRSLIQLGRQLFKRGIDQSVPDVPKKVPGLLHFEGDRDFSRTPIDLWAKLSDARFLLQYIPAVVSVSQAEPDIVVCRSRPGRSFLRGTLGVTVRVTEAVAGRFLRLLVQAKGVGTSSEIEATLAFAPHDSGARVHWTADVTQMSGLLKAVPHGPIKALAPKMIEDRWAAMEAQLLRPD